LKTELATEDTNTVKSFEFLVLSFELGRGSYRRGWMNIKIENVQKVWFTVVAGFMQKSAGCNEALRE